MRRCLILFASLIGAVLTNGCSQKQSLFDSYRIEEGISHKRSLLYQTGPSFLASSFDEISVVLEWGYQERAIFFLSNDDLSKDEASALMGSLSINGGLENECYLCHGSNLYSFSERAKIEKMSMTIDLSNYGDEILHPGFYADIDECFLISNDHEKEAISFFVTVGTPSFALI